MPNVLDFLSEQILLYWLDRRAAKHRREFPPMAVFAHDFIGNHINVLGQYERDELELLEPLFCKAADFGIALDVGANIGNHSLALARHFSEVVCFEPNPRANLLLSLNTRNLPNVTVHPFGLSDRSGQFDAFVRPANAGGASLYCGDPDAKPVMSFSVRPYDSLLGTERQVALVKIDIEGHEAEAFQGMRRMLSRDWPVVLFECNGRSEPTASSRAALTLRNIGYDKFHALIPGETVVPRVLPTLIRRPIRVLELLARSSLRKPRIRVVEDFESVNYPLVIATRAGTVGASLVPIHESC